MKWTIASRNEIGKARIDDAAAAARMTVEFGERLWELKIGYDERWAKCSPGIILMHETLRYACEKQLKGYEFLGHFEPWQQRWPLQTTHHATVGFYPFALAGGLSFSYDVCRLAGRKAIRFKHQLIRKSQL